MKTRNKRLEERGFKILGLDWGVTPKAKYINLTLRDTEYFPAPIRHISCAEFKNNLNDLPICLPVNKHWQCSMCGQHVPDFILKVACLMKL